MRISDWSSDVCSSDLWHAEDRAGVFHKGGPQQPQLKGKHGARYRAGSEKNGYPAAPRTRKALVKHIAGFQVNKVRNRHEEGHNHADTRKDNVETERHGHLGAGSEEVIHGESVSCCVQTYGK